METELHLRITIVQPPEGVVFRLQKGKTATAELVAPSFKSGQSISFDFTVRAVCADGETDPVLRGPFAQGPPDGRFVYVNSGTCAGQADSCWTRRAKVPLTGITRELVERASARPNMVLEGIIQGTGRDGGPACATVRLLDGGWRVVSTIAAA
jgi:hypothetical protein